MTPEQRARKDIFGNPDFVTDVDGPYGLNGDLVLLSALIARYRAEDAMVDLATHRASWRDALEIARDTTPLSTDETDDRSYWEHELRAFDRTFDALVGPSR